MLESFPLISVALCVYNGERYLREQLDSTLAQTGVRLEVVAVDDGSTDGSVALLREYETRDSRLRVIVNPENLGPRRSFEKAMALGSGEFIAACDQDDIWEPGKLARLIEVIGDHDLAYCDSVFVDATGEATGRHMSDCKGGMMHGRAPLRFVFGNSVSGHATLLRRSLFDASRPFPEGVYHDWWLAMSAAMRGGIVYLDEPLVRFRRHDAAFSLPTDADRPGSPGRYRRWLEGRQRLLEVYSMAMEPCSPDIADLRGALDRAILGRGRGPLLRALWRTRAKMVAPGESAWRVAIRRQLRFMRVLRRTRHEVKSTRPTRAL